MIYDVPIVNNNPVSIPISVPIEITIKADNGETLQWDRESGYFVTTIPDTRDRPIFFPTPASMTMLQRRFNCNPRALMEGRLR